MENKCGNISKPVIGLCWCCSSYESAFWCRGHRFDPWSGQSRVLWGSQVLSHICGAQEHTQILCSTGEATVRRSPCPQVEQPPVLCTQRKSAGSGKDPARLLKTLKSSKLSYKQRAMPSLLEAMFLGLSLSVAVPDLPSGQKQAGPKHPSPSSSLECGTVPNTQLALSKSW